MFQNDRLFDAITVKENIAYGIDQRTFSKSDLARKVEHTARLVGVDSILEQKCKTLSGGQRQALTLIMACMSHPKLLLLDEHTAALDPGNARIVMDLTEEYIRKERFTAMMITHNMQFAIEFGNRLIMMDEGRIILEVCGEEKSRLTVPELIRRFRQIRNKDFASDEELLTEGD